MKMRHFRAKIINTAFWFAGLLGCFVLLATVALMGLRIWLNSPAGQEYIKGRLKTVGVEIEDIRIFGIVPKRARLEKVRVEAALGQRRFEAHSDQISLKWSVAKFFLADIAITDLLLSNLHCTFEPAGPIEDGSTGDGKSTFYPLPRSISIDRLQIEKFEILGAGLPISGQICANTHLKAWARNLSAHIELLAKDGTARPFPCQIDLTSDMNTTRLKGSFDTHRSIKDKSAPQSVYPLEIEGHCRTDALSKFALKGSSSLPFNCEMSWRANQSGHLEIPGGISLNQYLPLEINTQAELLSKDQFDIFFQTIRVQSALGSATGRGKIDNGQWRDCELQMQLHRPIQLPKPLKSLPATKSTAHWSGPLNAPTISFSILPFGRQPQELASEYKLKFDRYRKDPSKWLFDLILKDRSAVNPISNGADCAPTSSLRQVAEGDIVFCWDQGPQLQLSARGIAPSISPVEGCQMRGGFFLKTHLLMPTKSSERVDFSLQSQIAEISLDSSLVENAHLSIQAKTPFAELQRDWKSLVARSDSQWQLFCTKIQRGNARANGLSGQFQQMGSRAHFQLSTRDLSWRSLNHSSVEDLSADGMIEIDLNEGNWSCALRQIETSIDGNRLTTSQPIHLFGAKNRWELANLHLQVGQGAIGAHIQSDNTSLLADLSVDALPLSLANFLFDTELQGQLSGELHLHNHLAGPHFKGQIQTHEASFFQNGEFRPLDAKLDLAIDQKASRICFSTSFFEQPLLIEGQLPWQFMSRAPFFAPVEKGLQDLSINLRGEIGPFISLALPPGQRVKGDVKVALQCQNRGKVPTLKGAITVQNGEYIYEKARVHLRDIRGEIFAKEGQLHWEGVLAQDSGGGELTCSGKAALWPHFTLQSSLDLSKIAYTHAGFVKGRVSGLMQWVSDERENHLRGNLKLADAQIKIPDQMPADIPVIAQGLRQHREDRLGNSRVTSLDINMEIPPRVDISGRGLSSKWGGWLHVGGESADAHLEGVLKLNKGIFTFEGRQFNIVDSHIQLGDQRRSEPSLQIIAEYPVEGATVRAIFRGRLKSPELIFESTPQLSLNEMLSRVLFDTSFNAINPLQAIQVADAALSISGNRFAPIGQFKRNIKLDQISVHMPDPDEKKYVLQVGKYLKNGVLVGVKQNIDYGGSDVLVGTQVSVEKQLRKHLTAKIEVGFQSQSTLNLLWKRDY